LREFKTPLIAATATTCVVFIPLFTLPGTLGKFLSFIPITIFITLVGALIISLMINPTMYFLLNKDGKKYIRSVEEDFLDDEEKELLALERQGKEEVKGEDGDRRHRIFGRLINGYGSVVRSMVYATRGRRRFYFVFPFFLFILSFMLPIKTIQFPQGDANFISVSIAGPAGSHHSYFEPYLDQINQTFSNYPELENFSYTAEGNSVRV
jgi:multidrug efflux pump subunit AcrB